MVEMMDRLPALAAAKAAAPFGSPDDHFVGMFYLAPKSSSREQGRFILETGATP
jgi:hypothetical protein